MKIALITDQHFGARGDNIQFHEYFSFFYKEFFFPFLEANNIDTIVELGDMFDRRKYVNYDTLARCRDYWFDEIVKRGMHLHCIVGNHDIYYKNTNRVNSPDLLLGEYNCSVYSRTTEVELGGLKILFVPWIAPDNYEHSMETIGRTDSTIVMGHLELQGFEMYRGAMNDHGLDRKVFSKFDAVMSGHFHHKSSKDNIHYLGAPYEMTWSDYDDDRGFHLFDTETKELTFIKNPYSMFYKIFYDDVENNEDVLLQKDLSFITNKQIKVIVKNKQNPYVFDLYMDRVNSLLPSHVQVVEDNMNVNIEDDNIIDEAEDTLSIVRQYIENLNIDPEKSRDVVQLFSELHEEALSIE
jgi:UDP-2,3-diacylglucosamine pyrophosphatase LpxH